MQKHLGPGIPAKGTELKIKRARIDLPHQPNDDTNRGVDSTTVQTAPHAASMHPSIHPDIHTTPSRPPRSQDNNRSTTQHTSLQRCMRGPNASVNSRPA
mmetsp:Transcript_29268/g.84669  ORF Transcript_29268/g.84669 Transcript_29268/m.84669 type:complete len:99 (-) Transcript_29268:1365-1661(-)